ncbi:microcin C ABC transporter permease YejB [Endozoicomonas sp. SM1973]|uniref:Inner membrane ABC transporter permease protein YejB n=1 Tax=Spartinivicinus marinus TaxID=2994442 RepID=A0A853II16_9GAMM|nr:microcin C ABC transporter permease YejB [Spartinivicinus marinus]MCX4024804.1 microcin C ABC transporter permease YejB [Spartinivicinus marinus]NYZ68755.1 microcin C ABC transporter permease YejB [Spartinivicinus marinus]
MFDYILRRLLLIIPTLLGIMVINFIIIQAAPGGPVEQMIARLQGLDTGIGGRLGTGSDSIASGQPASEYRGAQGLNPELIENIKKLYGFDKPAHERFFIMLKNYAQFDFGESFFHDKKVIDLIIDKLPVSISLGLWSTLLVYLISIPLGIKKAVKDGSHFDIWTSTVIIVGYAIPSFLFAILLIVFLAGGTYLDWFPLRGLTSDNFDEMSAQQQIVDYLWHITLPVISIVIGSFATLTMLTKNSFLDEIHKQYVITARAKGLAENKILYGHVFRNAMLIIIAQIPAALVGIFFTSSLLIEVIFSLDGLGLLGFEAAIQRDYPVVFGTLFIFTLIGLILKLIGDISYMLVDPRIDFESREG